MGTPLLAAERGVLDNIGTGTLGGIKLWVVGESGTHYYYAHLIAYAEGIHEGMVVEAGDVIGYVGNTGNAISTPPHLHFEIHPDGGEAIDPYPLLHAVDQVDGRHVLPPLVA
jgi:murein DD-endopeptidase MepM/ murein hydrolase activator NlpD